MQVLTAIYVVICLCLFYLAIINKINYRKAGAAVVTTITSYTNLWERTKIFVIPRLRDDIYSLHRGRFYVWASELFSFIMAFRYTGGHSIDIGVLFHTFYWDFCRGEQHRLLHRAIPVISPPRVISPPDYSPIYLLIKIIFRL